VADSRTSRVASRTEHTSDLSASDFARVLHPNKSPVQILWLAAATARATVAATLHQAHPLYQIATTGADEALAAVEALRAPRFDPQRLTRLESFIASARPFVNMTSGSEAERAAFMAVFEAALATRLLARYLATYSRNAICSSLAHSWTAAAGQSELTRQIRELFAAVGLTGLDTNGTADAP
jgi:hypothetical protein